MNRYWYGNHPVHTFSGSNLLRPDHFMVLFRIRYDSTIFQQNNGKLKKKYETTTKHHTQNSRHEISCIFVVESVVIVGF